MSTRWEAPGWQVDTVSLRLVTKSPGIAGNGLPPREGQQFRVRRHGHLAGYVRDVAGLAQLMGSDFNQLTEVGK